MFKVGDIVELTQSVECSALVYEKLVGKWYPKGTIFVVAKELTLEDQLGDAIRLKECPYGLKLILDNVEVDQTGRSDMCTITLPIALYRKTPTKKKLLRMLNEKSV